MVVKRQSAGYSCLRNPESGIRDPRSDTFTRSGPAMNEKPRMDRTVQHLADQLRAIRSGTISIGLIATVRASIEDNLVPINRLGTSRMQGDRIVIAPFDRANVRAI